MTINKRNLSTTANGADIFVVDGTNSPFTNRGALSTSGDLASTIRAAADGVTITNKESLSTSGDGSPGIVVGDPFGANYDNVTVLNYGTITATGLVFDDGLTFGVSGGIEFYGGSGATGINYGTIDAVTEGIGLAASNSTLLNYGSINAYGAGLYIQGIVADVSNVTAVNYGDIHTLGDEAYGIALFGQDSVVKNLGSIEVDGIFDFGIALAGSGIQGENRGTILGTGDLDRGVVLEGEDNSFVNYGSITTTGEDSIGIRFSGENEPSTNGGIFTNHGKVISAAWAVRGSFSDDHVVNRGLMTGNVDLQEGADSYVAGAKGSLLGALTLGDGDDLIVFEKGGGKLTVTDFVAGAGTDDVIDVSAFGYHSLSDVLSHATQSGADVVLKFGTKDQIVLKNVSVASLHSDDFAFAASLHEATAEAHVPHGDYIFA
jgi:hypothetical protein